MAHLSALLGLKLFQRELNVLITCVNSINLRHFCKNSCFFFGFVNKLTSAMNLCSSSQPNRFEGERKQQKFRLFDFDRLSAK